MRASNRWSHIPIMAGLLAMLLGAIDPLEGSLVILAGTGAVAFGARASRSRYRTSLYWSVALVAIGVGAMWALSAAGGLGGTSGRSPWWALVLLSYPVGWIMGLVGGLREIARPAATF